MEKEGGGERMADRNRQKKPPKNVVSSWVLCQPHTVTSGRNTNGQKEKINRCKISTASATPPSATPTVTA